MEQLHCKNCGAPIEHKYTHRCKYCDTVIFSVEEDLEEEHWIIDDISEDDKEELEKNEDILDLKASQKDIERMFESCQHNETDILKSLIMVFVSLASLFAFSNLPYIIKIITEK